MYARDLFALNLTSRQERQKIKRGDMVAAFQGSSTFRTSAHMTVSSSPDATGVVRRYSITERRQV